MINTEASTDDEAHPPWVSLDEHIRSLAEKFSGALNIQPVAFQARIAQFRLAASIATL
jgi:hypothetical protein